MAAITGRVEPVEDSIRDTDQPHRPAPATPTGC